MATGKRKPLHSGTLGSLRNSFRSSRLNFRPMSTQEDRGGTRPTPAPSSIGLTLVTMFLHVCKRSLLYDTKLKVAIYCGVIFVISVIADNVVMPRTYFSRSDNVLNQYFVKWGWGWLLTVTVPWVALTTHTLGCGRKSILVKHLARLVLATVAWLMWTKLFNHIETFYGRCVRDYNLQTKEECLKAGKFWNGFDISGHTFILIYSSLILAEEGMALVGWEGITSLIMNEEHARNSPNERSTGPLRNLSDADLEFLKKAHKALTPYLRGLFVAMTLQQLLWDVMLISTVLYYHIMIEKLLGGIAAILTWYVTYHWWYKLSEMGLPAPGEGLFKYNEVKSRYEIAPPKIQRNSINGSRFTRFPPRTNQENAEVFTGNRQMEFE